MIQFKFGSPFRLSEHFYTPHDETDWAAYGYRQLPNGHLTPDRPKAAFGVRRSMRPLTHQARELRNYRGLYLLAFAVPEPAYYVGISAGNILDRLRRHRIKATGSHVGTDAHDGGVNHTEGWPPFASRRARHYRAAGLRDACDDAVLFVGALTVGTCLNELAHVERCIDKDHCGVRSAILRYAFPAHTWNDVIRINTRSGSYIPGKRLAVSTWDADTIIECDVAPQA